MMKIDAFDLLFKSEEEMWSHVDDTDIIVMFSDKEVQMSWRQVILSWSCWEVIRNYPELPISHNYAFTDENFKVFTRDIPNQLIGRILSDLVLMFPDIKKEHLMKLAMLNVNYVDNLFWSRIQDYTTGLNALDLIEIVESPEFVEIVDGLKPTHYSINKAYQKSFEYLESPTWKPNNPICRAIKEGNINKNQTVQVTTARGFCMEIDQVQFPKPNLSSFSRGSHDIHDLAIESRSASISQVQATDPISDTEYFNRRLQLLDESIRYLIPGDCGSEFYVNHSINKNNMNNVIGMNYVTDSGEIRKITKDESKQLIGKVIRLRSALTCRHLHLGGVCETCVGGHAKSMPANTSLGHTSAMVVGNETAQPILGTKHLLMSVMVEGFTIREEDESYIKVIGEDNNKIALRKDLALLKDHDVYIVLDANSVSFVKDIQRSNSSINYSRLTEVEKAQLGFVPKHITDPDERDAAMVYVTIEVSERSRNSFLTEEFSNYVLTKQFEMVSRKFVKIDLNEWNIEDPIFELPLKRTMMVDFLKQFASLIETKLAKLKIDAQDSAGLQNALEMTTELLETFIKVPTTYVCIVLAAMLIRSRAEGDYRLPTVDGPREFGNAKQIMKMRSLSTAMAFEEHVSTLIHPAATITKLRANHPFDAVLMPHAFNIEDEF